MSTLPQGQSNSGKIRQAPPSTWKDAPTWKDDDDESSFGTLKSAIKDPDGERAERIQNPDVRENSSKKLISPTIEDTQSPQDTALP